MANVPSDQQQPGAPRSAPNSEAEFSIWWPQTRPRSDLWKLLLGVVAAAGALREYLSMGYRFDLEDLEHYFFPLVVSAATGAIAWYIILVVIRYVAYWIAGLRRR